MSRPGVTVAVTDHAASRFGQRVRGSLDAKTEIAARVARAWAADRVEAGGATVRVRDVRDRSLVFVCRHDPRSAELVVISLWEEGDDARVPRRFTDTLRDDARAAQRERRRGRPPRP